MNLLTFIRHSATENHFKHCCRVRLHALEITKPQFR